MKEIFRNVIEKLDNWNEATPSFNIYIIVYVVLGLLGILAIYMIYNFVTSVTFKILIDAGCAISKNEDVNLQIDTLTGHKRRSEMRRAYRKNKEATDNPILFVLGYIMKPVLKIGVVAIVLLFVLKVFPQPLEALFRALKPSKVVQYLIMDVLTLIAMSIIFIPVFQVIWIFTNPYISAFICLYLFKLTGFVNKLEYAQISGLPKKILNVVLLIAAVLAAATILFRVLNSLVKFPDFLKTRHDIKVATKLNRKGKRPDFEIVYKYENTTLNKRYNIY